MSAEALERERPDGADDAWKAAAACRGQTALFFPPLQQRHRNTPTPEAMVQIRKAKAICAQCPVLEACGAYVRSFKHQPGIWAGTTERERRQKAHTHTQGQGQGRRTDLVEKKGHGTESMYSSGGCRCSMCRAGHAAYVARRKWDRDHSAPSSTGLPTPLGSIAPQGCT